MQPSDVREHDGELQLQTYDLYLLAPGTGLIVGWQKFASRDHDSAIQFAAALALRGAHELWHDQTLVMRWNEGA